MESRRPDGRAQGALLHGLQCSCGPGTPRMTRNFGFAGRAQGALLQDDMSATTPGQDGMCATTPGRGSLCRSAPCARPAKPNTYRRCPQCGPASTARRIPSNAPGSSSVERSPASLPSTTACKARRSSFPERVLGNAPTT